MANALGTEINALPTTSSSRETIAQQKDLIPQMEKARVEAEMLPKQALAAEKTKAAEFVAGKYESKIEDNKRKEAEFPYPEFHPTQENAASLGGLFSLVATMGVALGGAGKLSSMNALNAMGGMLKGWQQGRKDLYEKEKTIFDKEFARIKQIRTDLQKDLDNYFKLAPLDKEAAYAKAEEMAYKNPGVAAAMIRSGQFDKLYELNNGILKAQFEVESKSAAGGKLSPKMEAELQSNLSLANNLADLSRKVDWLDKNEPYAFGIIFGNVPEKLAQQYLSKDALQTKAMMANLMTKQLKDRSGATVTVQEWARAAPFIPTPQDSPTAIQSKIRSLYDLIAEETEIYAERSKAGAAMKEKFSTLPQPLQPSFRPEAKGETTAVPAAEKLPKETVDDYRSKAKAKIAAEPTTEDKVKKRFKDLTGEEL